MGMMKRKTGKMVEEEKTIFTCDNCGEELKFGREANFLEYGTKYERYCFDCIEEVLPDLRNRVRKEEALSLVDVPF